MINVKAFFDVLNKEGVKNFSGVPDSLLKYICAYISDNTSPIQHTITANEGSAVALAAGQFISSGEPSLVYMQNSGFGNALNPLLSLADPKVYSIPMLVMIGWRGEPGIKDEPQHIKQGEIMEELLNTCQLPTYIINNQTKDIENILKKSVSQAKEMSCPVVLLVKKDTFEPYKLKNKLPDFSKFSRESAIEEIVNSATKDDIFVSTTGMASRELYEIRIKKNYSHANDFLTVGSMGHANMIALGISQSIQKKVFCIDGDGASLMHLGNLTTIGQSKSKNFIHILLNNAAHDSVGGQPTIANEIDIASIAKTCGYSTTKSISSLNKINNHIEFISSQDGPHFIEIKVKKGSRENLGRPLSSPIENKLALMEFLNT